MGRGRFGVGKIVPPRGWRWAPPANAHARCVGMELLGKKGGGTAGVRTRFAEASKKC